MRGMVQAARTLESYRSFIALWSYQLIVAQATRRPAQRPLLKDLFALAIGVVLDGLLSDIVNSLVEVAWWLWLKKGVWLMADSKTDSHSAASRLRGDVVRAGAQVLSNWQNALHATVSACSTLLCIW